MPNTSSFSNPFFANFFSLCGMSFPSLNSDFQSAEVSNFDMSPRPLVLL